MLYRLLTVLFALVLVASCARRAPKQVAERPAPPTGPEAGVFYVAPNGNDSGNGSLPEAKGGNAPFASVGRAVEAAREWKKKQTGTGQKAAAIFMRGGTYPLDKALTLAPEDSDLLLAAYQNERPVISAGKRITNWKPISLEGKSVWAAELPEVREGKWFFRELWVNGKRAVRARYPEKGYLALESLLDKSADWMQGHRRFKVKEGDIKPVKTLTNAEVVVMTRWVESRLPITGFNESERVIEFSKRSVFELGANDLYYIEGALEHMDQPGEWHLDRASGMLYYVPLPNEKLGQTEIVAPYLSQVVRLEGHPESGHFVQRVAFRGLTFSHSEWCFPDGFAENKDAPEVEPKPNAEVGGFAQAAIGVPAAVWGKGVKDSVFDQCKFTNLGNYGVELGRGCQGNRISRCEFSALGAGGIKIGETRIRSEAADRTSGNEISNCLIHDGGKMFHSAIGVWIGQSPNNRLVHNVIYDFYYTGISIGWTWGYDAALASGNIVEFNHVHHIGVRTDGDGPILSDMAGIYTLGKQPGTVIRNNLWHDMAATRYGGWGIYFDEGSSGILAESNIVHRTTHGGFHQHYGETNIVRNNVFAFGRDHQIQRTRSEPHLSFTFVTNIVYFDSGVIYGGNWADDKFKVDYNLFFDTRPGATPATLKVGPESFEKWRERGHDRNSKVGDPLFVAPESGDFRFRINSPATRLGFRPIDVTQIGVQKVPE